MSSEPGALPPRGTIPLSIPEIRGNEWKYVKECLDTNGVSSVGSYVDRFESELAAYVGSAHGVAVTSGTAALHIALLVAGVQPDDEVLVGGKSKVTSMASSYITEGGLQVFALMITNSSSLHEKGVIPQLVQPFHPTERIGH